MKEIKAFIRPNMLDAVLHALHEHPGLPGVTVSEVRGFGKVVGGDLASAPGFDTTRMAKVECIVEDAQAAEVIELIRRHANTGRFGDGKIVTVPIESVVRIRTGDSGE